MHIKTFYKIALITVLAVLLSPQSAWAHEKWFVDVTQYPMKWELLFSWPVAVALVTAGAALTALFFLQRLVRDPLFPNPPWLRPVNPSVQAVLGIQTAISLVYMAVQGWLLGPNLFVGNNPLGLVLLAVQVLVSFTFVTGWFTRLGGALLVLLVVITLLVFPPELAAEQVLFIGIGIYFLIRGRGLFRPQGELVRRLAAYWSRYDKYALAALRIFSGLSLLWLAFSEKLLNPDLGLAFLREYPHFNFPKLLGFTWFSDELFLYAAAAVEATVGVLLIAGVLPRVVILFMWVPFNVTIPFLPPQELLGHLPILAIMYALFLLHVPSSSTEGEPISQGAAAKQYAQA